ncbi:thymidylate synthase [Salipaludibacillus agaradhaerens]|uniref:thymidylate synthase n=1 Tax=Salipaludibacillus agaradhaerens TaxID=76935 RepID=UPI002150F39C|nr:thymidylate synthase [Salipaludibacillus agaradhaerens]MCR6105907.1 thymidylate synthase [Salipaludibacillus agaradhaerens]MCR6117940.1 thymidylate synthase [Salipaludibacillus agaradhaerens]UJW57082.1 thymidylate synthase [Bacillus sp. A116_S68]
MKFSHFEEAYLHTMDQVYYSPEYENNPRGFKSKERLNCSFEIKNPIERVCYKPSRQENIIFNFAEALWYLSGSNKLDFIRYYASNIAKYSADGEILTGTAYGPKLFSFGENKINQWERLINVLIEDKDTKRGFIQIFDANEDIFLRNIDVSCTIGLQFFQRENDLHLCTFMRANDAFRGIVSDIFSFTFIQEMMATQLGLNTGKYYHNVATMHIYEPDNPKVESVLSDETNTCQLNYSFPSMPHKNNWEDLRTVIEYEALLRNRELALSKEQIDAIEIDEYWKQLITLFAIYQSIYYSKKIDAQLYHTLLPIYQYFVKNKWASLL